MKDLTDLVKEIEGCRNSELIKELKKEYENRTGFYYTPKKDYRITS